MPTASHIRIPNSLFRIPYSESRAANHVLQFANVSRPSPGHKHLHCEITITEVLVTVQVDADLGKKGSIKW